MRKTFAAFLIVVLGFLLGQAVCAKGLGISAKSAVLMCADNAKVIYGKDEHVRLSMASTTKIMTALLTLEACAQEDKAVTITEKMVGAEGTSMYLQVGQVVPLSSLAKGMLSLSGNDAANAAAIAIGGSLENFAKMMNEKASQFGMKDTHFVTPSGLDAPGHCSTAYDMAILGARAIENPMFLEICSQKNVKTPLITPPETRIYRNHNRLLSLYPGCIGIKTGFTKACGRCLVSAAQRDGLRLVAVTLNAPDDWNDHAQLFDYGFSQVEVAQFKDDESFLLSVVGASQDKVKVSAKSPVKLLLKKGEKEKVSRVVYVPPFVYAPVLKDCAVGRIEYYMGGKLVATNELFSTESLEKNVSQKGFLKKIFQFFKRN